MKYKNVYFMNTVFNDGCSDIRGRHPYIILLDDNNEIREDVLALKSKTFNPIKHTVYVENGQSFGPINYINPDNRKTINKKSVVNLDEVYEFSHKTLQRVYEVSENDFMDLGIGLYYSSVDGLLDDSSVILYKKHEKDLKRHLDKHSLI